MNSDDLKLFALIIRAGSISRAAMELGADQSTVSRRVGQLESELGVRLLHRNGRGVTPTDPGRQLLDYAGAVAALLDQASGALREQAETGPAQLCIGAQPTIARILFGPLARALAVRYPQTRLRLVEALGSQILEKLGNGELDFAVIYLPEQIGTLQFDPLLSEGVHLIAPPGLGLEGDVIDLARLGELPLILPSTHHGLRLLVESLAARHGFTPRIALECDGSTALTTRLVMQHCGCTVLPLAAVSDDVASGRLRALRITSPEVRRKVGIVPGRNRAIPAGLSQVTRLVRLQVDELVRAGAWPDALLLDALRPAAPAG